MSCWALIPVKTPGLGKTRLSGVLSVAERRQLVDAMLSRVLVALAGSRFIDRIAIVGGCRQDWPSDAMFINDPGNGLNAALTSARRQLLAAGASELLVMHADLPLLDSSEIDSFITAGRRRQIALASDHHGVGTNAMYLDQLDDFAFRFGRQSLARHLAQAQLRGLKPALSMARGLRFDLDTVTDMDFLQSVLQSENLLFERHQSISQWSVSHA